jgi:hypothetical protein
MTATFLARMHFVLQELLGSLPRNRDWLNPDVEREMRALYGETKADAAPARPANFARVRQFLDRLPLDRDTDLAQCAAHLKDALDFADRVQSQKAAGYVSAAVLAALKDARIDGVGVSIYRQPFGDRIPVFTEPVASLGLLAAVSGFATKYLKDEREHAILCASDEHHKDVCDLFAAIEREGRAK